MHGPATKMITVLLSLLFLTACSTLPINGTLPDGLTAERIASVDKGAAFALSPDGNVVAIGSEEPKLLHISSKEYVPLGTRIPLKLAWSTLGYSLAAIYATDDGSSIVVYDQYGIAIAESPVNASLTSIGWLSEDELVAGGIRLKGYSFGSNYQSLFFRWKPGRNMLTEHGLRDTTLQPSTLARWKHLLQRGPLLDLSPQSETLLYLHPVDPPVFTPYYKLIMRDLASGSELEIASVDFNSPGGRFSADGERILYADGRGTTLLYDPWTEETLRTTNTPGNNLALSPEGENWVADGTLFRKDGAALPLAQAVEAVFSLDGSRIMLRTEGALYLLAGLKRAEGTLFVADIAEKIAKLRSMRLQRLVTAQEYKEKLQKVTAP